ncbi:hypothetical protein D3C71_2046100 [compost metagenome]
MQQQGGGDGIDRVVSVAALLSAAITSLAFGFKGRQAFIVGIEGQVKAAIEATGKFFGAQAHVVRCAVHV